MTVWFKSFFYENDTSDESDQGGSDLVEKKVKKEEVKKETNLVNDSDDERLPEPFPLPKNLMTTSANKFFFSSIAAAMFQYKKYPDHDEKANVGRQIVTKYPFLATEVSYVSFNTAYRVELLRP